MGLTTSWTGLTHCSDGETEAWSRAWPCSPCHGESVGLVLLGCDPWHWLGLSGAVRPVLPQARLSGCSWAGRVHLRCSPMQCRLGSPVGVWAGGSSRADVLLVSCRRAEARGAGHLAAGAMDASHRSVASPTRKVQTIIQVSACWAGAPDIPAGEEGGSPRARRCTLLCPDLALSLLWPEPQLQAEFGGWDGGWLPDHWGWAVSQRGGLGAACNHARGCYRSQLGPSPQPRCHEKTVSRPAQAMGAGSVAPQGLPSQSYKEIAANPIVNLASTLDPIKWSPAPGKSSLPVSVA